MTEIAIVPVKGPTDAKKRLLTYLTTSDRNKLVHAMLADVLNTLQKSSCFDEILVISPDDQWVKYAEQNRAGFLHQTGVGLNSAVEQATQSIGHRDVSAITVVLADLPLLEPKDIEELVNISQSPPRIVLAPSLKGGTNVFLRAPPNIIATSYGRWSYGKHLRAGQEKGVNVYTVSNSRLSFDVDTIHDLRRLRQLDPGGVTNAGSVAKDLGRLHPLQRQQ